MKIDTGKEFTLKFLHSLSDQQGYRLARQLTNLKLQVSSEMSRRRGLGVRKGREWEKWTKKKEG